MLDEEDAEMSVLLFVFIIPLHVVFLMGAKHLGTVLGVTL